MTKKELVSWIQQDITISGSIKISVPDAEIERIIDLETRNLWEIYPLTLQDSYTVIPVEVFRSKDFRENRTIQFPKCVKSITNFVEMRRRGAWMGFNDGDLTFNKMMMSDFWFASPGQSDYLVSRTMSMSVWDQLKAFNLVDIQFNFNKLTHKMLVLGHDPTVPVWCEMMTTIPDEDAWEDPWVRKWIAAKVRLSVQRYLGTFTTTLISGVTINSQMYADQANADITECKEFFKECVTTEVANYWIDMP